MPNPPSRKRPVRPPPKLTKVSGGSPGGTLRKLAWCSLLLWPTVILVMIAHRGVSVPYADQWDLVPKIEKYNAGTLAFSDLFAQHNEHRILVPLTIDLLLAVKTGWDIRAELFVNFAVSCVGAIFLVLLIRNARFGRSWTFGLTLLALILYFSPSQSENWLWGWQLEWFLTVTCVLFSAWALSSTRFNRTARFSAAAVATTIATYSLGSGALFWAAGLMMLVALRFSRRQIGIWVAAAVLALVFYYAGYQNPPEQPSKSLFLHQPLDFARYVLQYLASPLGARGASAIAVGAVLIVAFVTSAVYLARRGERALLAPWAALGLFAVASAVITGISRLGDGIDQAQSPRYITISTLLVVATCVMVASCVRILLEETALSGRRLFRATLVAGALAGLVLDGTVRAYDEGIKAVRNFADGQQAARACLHGSPHPSDECLHLTYPNPPTTALARLQYLREHHLGGF
jgi:hypothetical protein